MDGTVAAARPTIYLLCGEPCDSPKRPWDEAEVEIRLNPDGITSIAVWSSSIAPEPRSPGRFASYAILRLRVR